MYFYAYLHTKEVLLSNLLLQTVDYVYETQYHENTMNKKDTKKIDRIENYKRIFMHWKNIENCDILFICLVS